MREEIAAAVVFITRLVRKNVELSKEQVDNFSESLSAILVERFKNHWYQDNPLKGQGYRCIRVNETADPVLEQAAKRCGLTYSDLKLPMELTLWVDPKEVCCRFGETKGSYCTIASFQNGTVENKAHTVNIEGSLQKHEVRKMAEEKKRQQDLSSRSNTRAQHHPVTKSRSKSKLAQKFHGSPLIVSNNLNRHSNSRTFQKYHTMTFNHADRFHWVRGADLVKA